MELPFIRYGKDTTGYFMFVKNKKCGLIKQWYQPEVYISMMHAHKALIFIYNNRLKEYYKLK